MDDDRSNVQPKVRPTPVRRENEDGSTVMAWHLKTAYPIEAHLLMRVAADLSNDVISLNTDQLDDHSLVVSVESNKDIRYEAVFDFSMRTLLTIDKRVVELISIEGTDRDEWRHQFVVAEHCGTFNADKTPLMIAAETGDLEALRGILTNVAGTDIDESTPFGLNALGYAAIKGHMEAVKLLLNAGAQLSASGEITTLQAGLSGGLEIIRLLIAEGADVNCRNRYGDTALMTAAALGYLEIVNELLKSGADPDIKDNNFATALDHARQHERQEVLDALRRFSQST